MRQGVCLSSNSSLYLSETPNTAERYPAKIKRSNKRNFWLIKYHGEWHTRRYIGCSTLDHYLLNLQKYLINKEIYLHGCLSDWDGLDDTGVLGEEDDSGDLDESEDKAQMGNLDGSKDTEK